METKDVSGIYQIKNKTTNKIYIGSSKNIYKRWKTHISRLKYNKHCNSHLQSAWNKYGQNDFEFSIIETVNDLSELKELEQQYIDELQPFNERGYNLCKSTNSYMFERTMPDGWRENLKSPKTKSHILHMRQGNPNKKHVIVFNKCGEFLFEAISVGETKDILKEKYNINISKGVISGCCRHEYYIVYDMIFLYMDEYKNDNNILNMHINHVTNRVNRKVVSISMDFQEINIYESIKSASNNDKTKASLISHCCSNDISISNELYWLYYEDYIKHKDDLVGYIKSTRKRRLYKNIIQLDMRYNFIRAWETLDEIILNNNNFKRGTLVDCLNGKTLSAYKYRWILSEDYYSNNYTITNNNGQAKTIIQLDLNFNLINEWCSGLDIEKSSDVFKASSIKSVCNGRTKTHKYKDFYWYYKEDFDKLQLCSNE